ncbi:MAG: lamin tail domain-containing protein [Pyrinomonadaceae bacterium]
MSIENDGLGNLQGQEDLADSLWHQRASFFGTGFGDARAAGALIINGKRYTDNLLISALDDLPGLEQITVQVPRELRGAGQVSLQLEAGGRTSNVVTIHIASAQENEVVINEILFDPPEGIAGDANRDGTRSGTNDEFIELVNQSTANVSLSGWTISTRTLSETREKVVHRFSANTTLAQADALLVFGGGDFNGTHPFFGGAQALKASSGGLSLNNAGMSVLIRDGSGKLITELIWRSAPS